MLKIANKKPDMIDDTKNLANICEVFLLAYVCDGVVYFFYNLVYRML